MVFLEERGVKPVLFAYKDARFGCLSRAAAVLLHHWTDLSDFLAAFPEINNRLACLVREVMALSYLTPVFITWACFGVHLVGSNVSPYFTLVSRLSLSTPRRSASSQHMEA